MKFKSYRKRVEIHAHSISNVPINCSQWKIFRLNFNCWFTVSYELNYQQVFGFSYTTVTVLNVQRVLHDKGVSLLSNCTRRCNRSYEY